MDIYGNMYDIDNILYIHLLSIAAQIDRLDNVQWHNIQTVQFNNKQKIRCYKRIWNLLRAYTINDFLSFCVRANGTGYGCAFLSRLNTILSRLSGIRWLRQEFGFNILLKKLKVSCSLRSANGDNDNSLQNEQ